MICPEQSVRASSVLGKRRIYSIGQIESPPGCARARLSRGAAGAARRGDHRGAGPEEHGGEHDERSGEGEHGGIRGDAVQARNRSDAGQHGEPNHGQAEQGKRVVADLEQAMADVASTPSVTSSAWFSGTVWKPKIA